MVELNSLKTNIKHLKENNMDKYHGIVFGGGDLPVGNQPMSGIFRQPAPYKLRTIAKDAGYNIKAVDYTQEFSSDEINQLLENLVTKDTLFVGISCQHFAPNSPVWFRIYDVIIDFRKKSEYNYQIVMGGMKAVLLKNSWMEWDWIFTGYVDYDIIQWLHKLSGKANILQWKILHNKYKWIDGDSNPANFTKQITDNMEIEWLEEDHIQSYESLPVEISRGCRFECDFCEYPLLRSKQKDFDGIRKSLSKQLVTNKEKWGVTNYWFDDFTYNSHQGKLDLIDDIIKEIGFKIKFSTFIRPELIVAYPEQQQQLVEQGLNGVAFGMETITDSIRSSISKGGDINKINEAAAYMNKISKGQTSFLYLMMMGIPHQTIKEMEADRKYVQEAEHIDNFTFHPFWMGYPNKQGGDYTAWESKITLNPEKYGYHKDMSPEGVHPDNVLGDRFNWTNEHTSFLEVLKIKDGWEAEDYALQKVGGVSSMYFRGMGFDADNLIGKTLWKDVDMELSTRTTERIRKYINSVLSEKITT